MEILNFPIIVTIFKILAIIQIILFVIFFVITLVYKIWADQAAKELVKVSKKIQNILLRFNNLSNQELQFLKKWKNLAFNVFFHLEKENLFEHNEVYIKIINEVFLPFLTIDAESKNWLSRNRAAMLLQIKNKYFRSISTTEENHLMKLIADTVPLIAFNAAIAVCFAPSQNMMDFLITTFSQNRRSQYELITMMMNQASYKVIPFIQHRLSKEKDPYIRVFCYRMLRQLPKMQIPMPFIQSDLISKNVDLNLASLSYISYLEIPGFKIFLVSALQSPFWEVRARAAKIIGYTKDIELSSVLEPFLKDDVWWVRFRVAEALSFMGDVGLNILRSQNINIDKFAFEISQQQIESNTFKKNIL